MGRGRRRSWKYLEGVLKPILPWRGSILSVLRMPGCAAVVLALGMTNRVEAPVMLGGSQQSGSAVGLPAVPRERWRSVWADCWMAASLPPTTETVFLG